MNLNSEDLQGELQMQIEQYECTLARANFNPEKFVEAAKLLDGLLATVQKQVKGKKPKERLEIQRNITDLMAEFQSSLSRFIIQFMQCSQLEKP